MSGAANVAKPRMHVFAVPDGLHPETEALVGRFAYALAEKLRSAEEKYGYSDGWKQGDWLDECRAHLRQHVEKGDPRDVAAYCAFLWHHGESTATHDAAQGAVAWRPMETAPRDGTEVILKVALRAGVRGKMLVGHYMRGGHCIEDHPPIDAGWYFWNGRMFDEASHPLEWMPLPDTHPQAAPAQGDGEELARFKRALAEYPVKNTRQLQAHKVCVGVIKLAASYAEPQ